jgi:hypothetical protein
MHASDQRRSSLCTSTSSRYGRGGNSHVPKPACLELRRRRPEDPAALRGDRGRAWPVPRLRSGHPDNRRPGAPGAMPNRWEHEAVDGRPARETNDRRPG